MKMEDSKLQCQILRNQVLWVNFANFAPTFSEYVVTQYILPLMRGLNLACTCTSTQSLIWLAPIKDKEGF